MTVIYHHPSLGFVCLPEKGFHQVGQTFGTLIENAVPEKLQIIKLMVKTIRLRLTLFFFGHIKQKKLKTVGSLHSKYNAVIELYRKVTLDEAPHKTAKILV